VMPGALACCLSGGKALRDCGEHLVYKNVSSVKPFCDFLSVLTCDFVIFKCL